MVQSTASGAIVLSISWTHLFLLLWAAVSTGQAYADPSWDYNLTGSSGPNQWFSLTPDWRVCKFGREQSPIAINVSAATVDKCLGHLNLKYQAATPGVLINNGHDVQVEVPLGAGQLVLSNYTYELKGIHLHAPSEHVINNVRFPLEMHMVHKTPDESRVAVIAVLFRKSSGGNFLDQLWDQLQHENLTDTNVTHDVNVSWDKLEMGPSYARYQGSLTTPPCSQNVEWSIVLSQGNTVTQAQLNDLQKIMNTPNARPLQAPNGREVLLYKHK